MAGSGERRERIIFYIFLPATCVLLLLFFVMGWLMPIMMTEPRGHDRCPSNLRQIGMALSIYSADCNEEFPPSLSALYDKYVENARFFICPHVSEHFKPYEGKMKGPIPDEHLTYCYVSGLKWADPPGYVIAFDEEWNHKGEGVNVLYIGSNVEWKSDIKGVHEQLRKQAEELRSQGRDVRILRPSWSRYPERPLYAVSPRSRTWVWAAVSAGAILLAAAGAAFVIRRRRRKGLAQPS